MSALFTGKNLVHLDRASSTNSVLSEMLSNSKPLAEGSVIMADEQTQGRGQQGAFWESSPGKNLTFSLLYRPEFLAIESQFYLSMSISLGICDALEKEIDDEIKIKWPNDIYVGNKKIAGILIENALMGTKLKTSIIGIGLNVNQTEFLSTAPNPCSLKGITEKDFNLLETAHKLFEAIELRYLQLKAGEYEAIKSAYLHRLYHFKLDSYYKINGITRKCKIIDIEKSGRIVLLVNEEIKTFDTKEIEYIL